MSIARTTTESTYLPLVAHLDEELEALQAEAEAASDEVLDHDEQKLLEMLMLDLRSRPTMGLSILRRRGVRTFVISIDQSIELSFSMTTKGKTSCSKLQLSSTDPLCRQEVLQKVVQVACTASGVTLVKDVTLQHGNAQKNFQLFVFSVDFG
jgi:hypothetical protein